MEKGDFGKIRKAIESNRAQKENWEVSEYGWGQYDSPLEEIGSSFIDALPEEYAGYTKTKIFVDIPELGDVFKKYVEDTLGRSGNKRLTAIEFGGPGSQLFRGFTPGFFKKTVGVCLDDIRDRTYVKDDENISHSVVSGDVLDVNNKKMFNEIIQRLGSEKADLIIERMMGPLRKLDKHPAILKAVMQKWYGMLNTDGVMFIQFEYLRQHNPNMEQRYTSEFEKEYVTPNEKLINDWANKVSEIYADTLDVQIGRGILRLVKKQGAPEKLPMEEVLEQPK